MVDSNDAYGDEECDNGGEQERNKSIAYTDTLQILNRMLNLDEWRRGGRVETHVEGGQR